MIVDLAIPLRVHGSFDYLVPEDALSEIEVGNLVSVTFGRKKTHGFVLGFKQDSDVPAEKLKPIGAKLRDEPLFDEPMMEFLKWVSKYYCHPLGEVFNTAIPKQCWNLPARKTKVRPLEMPVDEASKQPLKLTEEQAVALKKIQASSRPVLLEGVTGSGKTEIYLQMLSQVRDEDKGAIVLVPEISLTPQLLSRFNSRFPGQVAVLHSSLTPRERRDQWQRVWSGEAPVVIGPRSAVFAPVKSLGLIIVDEEHEGSFKQEDGLRYHGRDVAILRAHMSEAKIILGSATPCLESIYNATCGKYEHVRLTKRVMDRPMPVPRFVQLGEKDVLYREDLSWLSRSLKEEIDKTLEKKEQVLLYLNRLGYSHFLFCQDCGQSVKCPHCDVSLTYYQRPTRVLKCHYCRYQQPPLEICGGCSGRKMISMGVGTEQVEKGLGEIFPHARIARMDRSVVQTRKSLETLLHRIHEREVDIIIGTQMVTKGHDFPGISLVGILLADSSLGMPDFRAQEKTFQMITQVAGRAGRAEVKGQVIIQTFFPDHPVLHFAATHDSQGFYEMELASRRQFNYPPFQKLALLRFQHTNASTVRQFANHMVTSLQNHQASLEIEILGPSEAPLTKINKHFRWMCLLKSPSTKQLHQLCGYAHHVWAHAKGSVQFAVDMDPVNLF